MIIVICCFRRVEDEKIKSKKKNEIKTSFLNSLLWREWWWRGKVVFFKTESFITYPGGMLYEFYHPGCLVDMHAYKILFFVKSWWKNSNMIIALSLHLCKKLIRQWWWRRYFLMYPYIHRKREKGERAHTG